MPSVSEPAGRRDALERIVGRARTELREWADSAEHDPGVALVELLALLGDTLTSYADRIANEAYLGEARRRPGSIRVDVDGERWREVPSLADSGPDDDHYAVTTQQDGAAVIQFGDGQHGRRPSPGSEIHVRYRRGFTSVQLQEGRVLVDADWNEASGNTTCGIYRAIVVDNVDPLMKRRLRVLVPQVAGDDAVWAMACVPPGAADEVPSVGDPMWVAFESCDPAQPVWLGRLIA